ncbi:S24 family peptidase [Pseudophaeobacter sp.]|uniref:S24 family peptidase n=1 Tax=Pseudophaeobacter sp. TaxID=1971739 RepID=UPI003298E9E5
MSGNQSIIGGDQIPDGFVPIPRMEVRASAGNGRVAIMNDAEAQVVAFKEEWLRRLGVSPRNATIIVADGDSMADTIGHGDLVLLDRSIDHVVDNGIYVLVYGGMVLLKRVQVKRNGVVLLKSDNPRYETEEIQSHEVPELIIEGRVRWAGGAL